MLVYPFFFLLTQKKCAFYKIHSVVCRGYSPPEYIDKMSISKKYDIFSLGVVMIKIVAGPQALNRYCAMDRDEFIDAVRNAVT